MASPLLACGEFSQRVVKGASSRTFPLKLRSYGAVGGQKWSARHKDGALGVESPRIGGNCVNLARFTSDTLDILPGESMIALVMPPRAVLITRVNDRRAGG